MSSKWQFEKEVGLKAQAVEVVDFFKFAQIENWHLGAVAFGNFQTT